MKIVILGAGGSGCFAASALAQRQHDVTLIDCDPKVLDQVNRETDAAVVLASMPDVAVLQSLLAEKPDLFFAATGDDETNLVSCAIAKNLGFPKTASRIKSMNLLYSDALDIRRLFYTDHLIGAQMLSAQDLFKLLTHSSDSAFGHFAHGSVLMRSFSVPAQWKQARIPIKALNLPRDLVIGLIRRNTDILYPHGDDWIEPHDEVTLIGDSNHMNNLRDLFQLIERRTKSVILIGGSQIALHLSRLLLEQRIAVKIIEQNPSRCRFLADALPDATVINRDAKDPSLFMEENFKAADAIACCTKDDGLNFLLASLALHLGSPKAVALTSDPSFASLYEKAGIAPTASERINLTNRLLAILHASSFISVASLSNDAAKIVELKVSPASPLLGVPLANLHLPKDLLIAAIENHGKVMIGRGSSIFCPDDTVIAICSPDRLEQLHQLFR